MQTVMLYLEAELPSGPFGNVRQGGLWAEPAAPYSAEYDSDKKKSENENQGSQQDKEKFLDSEDLAEQVKVEARNINSQQAFPIYLQPGKYQEHQGARPLKLTAPWTYETVFIFHKKTGRE